MINFQDKQLLKSLREKYKGNFFIVTGIIGIILIFLSDITSPAEEKATPESDDGRYVALLEQKLESVLSSVHGAGELKVMITLEAGEENVYVRQEKSVNNEQTVSGDLSEKTSYRASYEYEDEIVMVEKGSDKDALVEKVLQPSVQGAVVVCKGADNIEVVSNITNAVSVALDIPTNRICVIKMQ